MPFLTTFHAVGYGWAPWTSVFKTPFTITCHPFYIFRVVECYSFSSNDCSLSSVSVDSKSSTRIFPPSVVSFHEQARTSRLSTPIAFALDILAFQRVLGVQPHLHVVKTGLQDEQLLGRAMKECVLHILFSYIVSL